jgi:hypothetical protein
LLSHYETLTRYLTDGAVTRLPAIEESTRRRINESFVRRSVEVENDVVLRYAAVDLVWAEWVEHVLASNGVRVYDPWARPDTAGSVPEPARVLRIVSGAELAPEGFGAVPVGTRAPLTLYVSSLEPANVVSPHAVTIDGLEASAAAAALLTLVGLPRTGNEIGSMAGGPRYPGTAPKIFETPPPNNRFTGRDGLLRDIRSQLRRAGGIGGTASTVVIEGMGGLGKTYLALEYAYRFRTAYDVVFWITAEPFAFVDSKIIELGGLLGISAQASGPNTTRAILAALGKGDPTSRWLLVFDNVDNPDLRGLLPGGRGHVLITSRDARWMDSAASITVDVFARDESIDLLHKRIPDLGDEDAARVADVLGDLPIAIAAAGA